MSSSVATAQDNLNPFLSYGEAANRQTIVGDLLKFSRHGTWEAGQDATELPNGTRLVVNMDEILIGWQRWSGGRPDEQRMGKIIDAYRPESRSELPDNDKELWDIDERGVPQDPWRLTNYVLMMDPNNGTMYTFSPSSKGGLSAVGRLCQEYGKVFRQKPDEFPVIALESSSYKHEKYGKIFTPELKVVGWGPKSVFSDDPMDPATAAEKLAGDDYKAAKGGRKI
jgi:hypothetical protein